MEEILETRQHKSLEDKWKWKVWVFPLSFFSFFLSHTLFQGSEKEKIPSAKQKTSLVLAKTLWVTAAGGPSSSGCARGAEHREGSSSCIHICCMPCVLWAYCHDLSMIFQEILSFIMEDIKDIHFSCDQKHKNIIQNWSWDTYLWN